MCECFPDRATPALAHTITIRSMRPKTSTFSCLVESHSATLSSPFFHTGAVSSLTVTSAPGSPSSIFLGRVQLLQQTMRVPCALAPDNVIDLLVVFESWSSRHWSHGRELVLSNYCTKPPPIDLNSPLGSQCSMISQREQLQYGKARTQDNRGGHDATKELASARMNSYTVAGMILQKDMNCGFHKYCGKEGNA